MKLCVDCRWCDDPQKGDMAKCTNPIFTRTPVGLVDGRDPYYYCAANRGADPCLFLWLFGTPVGCGQKGHYWEPRESSTTKGPP